MDGAVVTVILVITVIAVVEGVSLFADVILKTDSQSYYAVIPVMPDDISLKERIYDVMEDTDANIILLDCGANEVNEKFCRNFCINHENTVFLTPSELQNYFSKSFAIDIER